MFKRRNLIILVLVVCAIAVMLANAQERDRILAIDISEGDGEEYDTLFQMSLGLGMQQVGLSFDWGALEVAPGEYDGSLFEIMNIYYPAYGVPVDLTLRPIHTGTLQVPADLRGRALDDPIMIERFNRFLDFAFATMPDVEFSSLVIGSEFDSYLGSNADRWRQYTAFAAATADYARRQRPGLKIAFEAMFPAFDDPTTAAYLADLNAHADIIGVSYYPTDESFNPRPLTGINDDFAVIVEQYPDKPIWFYQYGLPSSPVLNSSEELQADFIRESFRVWDTYADHVQMIDFTWLTDMSRDEVAYFEDYYSYSSPEFAAFLGSLGLRHADGTPKLALEALREEAQRRGW